MGFFSRNKQATEAGPVADVPFETLRRQSRSTQRTRPLDSHFDAPPPLDPAETAKTRARRRLIGAIALALAAIVFVPMLFDRTPVATPDDIALQIPDRDTPFEGRRGVPDPTRAPLKGASELPVVVATPTPTSAPVQGSTAPGSERMDRPVESPADGPVESRADQPVDKAAEKPVTKAAVVAATKPVDPPIPKIAGPIPEQPKPATPTDDPKALAALDGKPDGPSGASGAASGKGYAVQVAAFSAADKARGLRDQLVAGGMKSYTEPVATAQGTRVRVRLGPFASRDAADRAKQKLKSLKLDGSVVPL